MPSTVALRTVVVSGNPAVYAGPVQAPPPGGTIIPPDNKWFISSAMCPFATPMERFSAAVQIP